MIDNIAAMLDFSVFFDWDFVLSSNWARELTESGEESDIKVMRERMDSWDVQYKVESITEKYIQYKVTKKHKYFIL